MTDTRNAGLEGISIPPDVTDGQILSDTDGYQLTWHPTGITRTETPGGTAEIERQLQERIATAIDTLETAATNWDTLTNTQKDNVLRLAVRAIAKLARIQLGQYDKTGD